MKHFKAWSVILCIVLLLVFLNLTENFSKIFFLRILGRTINFPYVILSTILNSEKLVAESKNLEEENEALRAKIFNYERVASFSEVYKRFKYVEGEIYSRYPFNNKDYLMIDRGLDGGLAEFMPVTLGESILIGKIDKVFSFSSRVKTIFNSAWQFGIRIGGGGNDTQALFVGGNNPKILYIDKDLEIKPGDVIYAASEEFPVGLKIAEIKEINLSDDNAFKEASINLPYNINNLKNVLVIINK